MGLTEDAVFEFLASAAAMGAAFLDLGHKIQTFLHSNMMWGGADCRLGKSAVFAALLAIRLRVKSFLTDEAVDSGLRDAPKAALREFVNGIAWAGEKKDEGIIEPGDPEDADEDDNEEKAAPRYPANMANPDKFVYRNAMMGAGPEAPNPERDHGDHCEFIWTGLLRIVKLSLYYNYRTNVAGRIR